MYAVRTSHPFETSNPIHMCSPVRDPDPFRRHACSSDFELSPDLCSRWTALVPFRRLHDLAVRPRQFEPRLYDPPKTCPSAPPCPISSACLVLQSGAPKTCPSGGRRGKFSFCIIWLFQLGIRQFTSNSLYFCSGFCLCLSTCDIPVRNTRHFIEFIDPP